jgi:hypothetical protein
MKKFTFLKSHFWLLILGSFIVNFTACFKDKCKSEITYVQYLPIFKTTREIRDVGVKFEAVRPLKNTGKIYFYENLVFINELHEGLHIYDNTQPANPKNLGFLKIEGNLDLSIKDGILYADNYMDLLTIDIRNYTQPRILTRNQDAFINMFPRNQQMGFVVGYRRDTVLQKMDCTDPNYETLFRNGWLETKGGIFASSDGGRLSNNTGVNGGAINTLNSGANLPSTGIGGSMARFTIVNDYLYALDRTSLRSFNISNIQQTQLTASNNVAFNIETVYPFKNMLLIGSMTGMFLYDISTPETPTALGAFSHARRCDPVVAEGNLAYVTLRSGSDCGADINTLDVVDITNPRAPKLVKTYPMKNPKGLSVWDNLLYLCDDGFKIFDVKDKEKVDQNLLTQIKGFESFDVIPFLKDGKKIAMVIAKDGFYQFDVTNATQPVQISKIPTQK